MSEPKPSIIDTRRAQMFPILADAEIERMRRFGEPRSFRAGDALARVGEVGHGMIIILAGEVDVTQHDDSGHGHLIVTHEPGAFMGELAQLAGRPALADPHPPGPAEPPINRSHRLPAPLLP